MDEVRVVEVPGEAVEEMVEWEGVTGEDVDEDKLLVVVNLIKYKYVQPNLLIVDAVLFIYIGILLNI